MTEEEKYPGKIGTHCAGCGWPIAPNGRCNCEWNHITKKKTDYSMDDCQIIIPGDFKIDDSDIDDKP